MNLRDLEYFVALAKYRHFGRAADACHVSQPSLSAQIKKLEETLGVLLIERGGKQTMLTEAGEDVLRHAQQILAQAEEIREVGRLASDPMSGRFRLGVIPTIAPYLLPRLLPLLQKHFPTLETEIYEGQTHHITAQLKQGELDAILLALPLMDDSLKEAELFRERFFLAAPTVHKLASKAHITPRDLQGEHLLLLEDGHCLRDQALEVCELAGASEYRHFRATSLETIRYMVASGTGITLLPEMAIGTERHGIAIIPFKPPAPHRSIGLAWRRTSPRQKLMQTMTEMLKKQPATTGS